MTRWVKKRQRCWWCCLNFWMARRLRSCDVCDRREQKIENVCLNRTNQVILESKVWCLITLISIVFHPIWLHRCYDDFYSTKLQNWFIFKIIIQFSALKFKIPFCNHPWMAICESYRSVKLWSKKHFFVQWEYRRMFIEWIVWIIKCVWESFRGDRQFDMLFVCSFAVCEL